MLCEYCAGFSIKQTYIQEADYMHQPSLAVLLESAIEGCGGCSVIYYSLIMTLSETRMSQLQSDPQSRISFQRCVNWCSIPSGNPINHFIRVRCKDEIVKLTLATEDDNAASQYVSGRVVDFDPASATTYRRIKSWISGCISSHPKCRISEPRRLPSRLLDVSPPCRTNQQLRLYVSADGETGDYIALSYCWGLAQPVTTTRTNLEVHKSGICEESLPKTIRDAISITRNIGIRFLWIDAFCIVQDSLNQEDWHRESSKTSEIYSNAFITISAEAAKNANAGFISQRSSEGTNRSFEVPYYLEETASQCGSVFIQQITSEYSPFLSYRAWAFQERRLSTRVLDYRIGQISLTCRSGMIQESCANFEDMPQNIYQEGSRPLLLLAEDTGQHFEILNEWYRAVEDYSRRDLTYEKDKLPALSGYAHAVQKVLGGTYLAGLWKQDLLIGLLWRAASTRHRLTKPRQRRAPSWSWAALNGRIQYDRLWILYMKPREQSLHFELIEGKVTTVGSDMMGQVTGGMLKISGYIKLAAWLPTEEDDTFKRDFINSRTTDYWEILRDISEDERLLDTEEERTLVQTDSEGWPVAHCLFDTHNAHPKYVWCLPVNSTKGLILEHLPKQNVYERVGVYLVSDPNWLSNYPISTITVV